MWGARCGEVVALEGRLKEETSPRFLSFHWKCYVVEVRDPALPGICCVTTLQPLVLSGPPLPVK